MKSEFFKLRYIKKVYILIGVFLATMGVPAFAVGTTQVELLIIGGGASGTTAGVQAARMGTKTLIVEETDWLGGMLTSAGVSAIDGNYRLPSGMWGEFKDALAKHYGGLEALKTGWVSNVQFEPSVGNKLLKEMVKKEKNLKVVYNTMLETIEKKDGRWVAKLKDSDGKYTFVKAKMLIDATELGDVAKMVGVKYDIGMESKSVTKEDIAPDEANKIVQDLTYVAVLKDYGKDVSIAEPAGYNPAEFACTCINDLCKNPSEPDRMWSREKLITYGELPNKKYMINWPIEGNDYYVNLIEMSREERIEALKPAKNYTMCFVYFLQHELGFKNLGLADDEFPTADRMPMIPYHRESRRIHGLTRFNLNHVTNPYDQADPLYRTCIAVGDYPVDHHHNRYQGYDNLPRLYFHPIPSYGLPLGTLIPKDVSDIIVAEKSISVSNIINGSTRLQPVVLQIGQASGVLASLALQQKKDVKDVKVRDVQNVLLDAGTYLLPYLDVEKSDKMFKPLQRIGSTGILRGKGINVEWSNQTWMRADTLLLSTELAGLKNFYPATTYTMPSAERAIKVGEAIAMIENIVATNNVKIKGTVAQSALKAWNKYGLGKLDHNADIKRGEFAVLIDYILDPFNTKNVDIKGNFIK